MEVYPAILSPSQQHVYYQRLWQDLFITKQIIDCEKSYGWEGTLRVLTFRGTAVAAVLATRNRVETQLYSGFNREGFPTIRR